MKQIWISPSILGTTKIYEVEIRDDGVMKVKRAKIKHATIDSVSKYLKGTKLPVFVDPSYPEVRDHLKVEGYWVVK